MSARTGVQMNATTDEWHHRTASFCSYDNGIHPQWIVPTADANADQISTSSVICSWECEADAKQTTIRNKCIQRNEDVFETQCSETFCCQLVNRKRCKNHQYQVSIKRDEGGVELLQKKTHRNMYKHIPHKDRPPLIVARRNARERRRVQAVNGAFMRLRKMVPIISNRGKRVSKVKTLQTAIEYIHGLQTLLKQTDLYHNNIDIISEYRCIHHSENVLLQHVEDLENEF